MRAKQPELGKDSTPIRDEPMPDVAPEMLDDPMDTDQPLTLRHPVPAWGQEIMEYLLNGNLPEDIILARRVQNRSKSYTIINHEMYKISVTGVFQRCVEAEEGREILTEIHQGECGHHVSSRALVARAFRHGFYRPTAL
jgi:hypothetical protein